MDSSAPATARPSAVQTLGVTPGGVGYVAIFNKTGEIA